MLCHHNVEKDSCPVCIRVPALRLVPMTPRLLHLARDNGAIVPEAPLCGTMDPQDRLSTLYAHDAARFCKSCLRIHEGMVAARHKRNFKEKARGFRMPTFTSHLDIMLIPVFYGGMGLGAILVVAAGLLGYWLAGGLGAAILAVGTLYLMWRWMVDTFG